MTSAVLWLGACYVYAPLYTAPAPGTRVSFELNDRGRAALEQTVGPEVATVEGILTTAEDSQLILSVLAVQGIRGGSSRWAGESVVFRPDYVRSMRERRISGGRTLALAAVLASSSLAFVATRTLLGGGNDGGPGGIITPPPAH